MISTTWHTTKALSRCQKIRQILMFWTHCTTTTTWSFLIFHDVDVEILFATGIHWLTNLLFTFTRPFSLPAHVFFILASCSNILNLVDITPRSKFVYTKNAKIGINFLSFKDAQFWWFCNNKKEFSLATCLFTTLYK